MVGLRAGCLLGATGGGGLVGGRDANAIRSYTSPTRTPPPTQPGPARTCPPRRSGSTPPAAGSTARRSPGATTTSRKRAARQHLARRVPLAEPRARRLRGHVARRQLPPNGYGLFDMAGNVWEWTTRLLRVGETRSPCCAPQIAVRRIPRRVIKGGSHLCAPNYCLRYRPAARQSETVDTSTSHIGFRCVVRPRGSWSGGLRFRHLGPAAQR